MVKTGIPFALLSAAVLLGIARGEDNVLKLEDIRGTFVAACKTGGQWSIWTFNADASKRVQLTSDAHADSDPRWSPDGKRIIFSSLRDGFPCLFLINRDGSDEKRICEGSQASWAPDGLSIVFQREGQIVRRNMKTSGEKIITPENWLRCSFPAISPDGSRFAVASRHRRTIGVYVGSPQQDKELTKVSGDHEACTPRWNPKGNRLLYQSSSHIYEVRSDGTDGRQLTFGADVQHMAEYSPDGTMIVYCRASSDKGPWQMYLLRLDDEAEARLPVIGESCMYPDWYQE